MRWDQLKISDDGDAHEAGEPTGGRAPQPLTLFDRSAVARTFDTPGFRGITFHEVHARSIISKVPEASRVPFRWTINPYRGCSHACAYCLAGQTPILMGDGRTRPLAELRPGDAVYGTARVGRYRRYVITDVLAHWSVTKPAYRVTLTDGTRLVCSSDHRFLTAHGWQHVTGAEQGSSRRRHLTADSKLPGVGAFAEPPKPTADYQQGYLCGVGCGHGRLAAAALDRTRDYLGQAGGGRSDATVIQALTGWPGEPTADWRKGYLAGVFDAEGSHSGALRIANSDSQVIGWAVSSLASLGFRSVIERPDRTNGVACVRLLGGLPEVLRFFHLTDPAVTGKRSIAGTAVKTDADLRVVSIEPLGLDLEMYDITTGTGDFIADGVISHNCFARNTHTYLDMDAGHDFDTQIVVKVNAPELLRRELRSPQWRGEHIAMGTNVDCYQRAEGRYRLMPGIITALTEAANPFSILTKGTLILRDLDLLARAAEVTEVGLNVSVGIVDKSLSRSIEPGTPSPDRRLAACAELGERGLRCGVLMGPVLPYLSDSPEQLAEAVRLIAAAGAVHVTPIVLHLRPGAREWFQRWLRMNHPELLGAYRDLYGNRAYAPESYQRAIADEVARLARKYGVGGNHDVGGRVTPAGARRVATAQEARPPGRSPALGRQPGVQLSLL